jgi:hypothetical protein
MRDNCDELPLFTQLASDLGVDCLFGSMIGVKGGQHEIAVEEVWWALDQTAAVIAASPFPMPLAELTLKAISPQSRAEDQRCGGLVTIAPARA